jgi:putative RecB family exonuclease
MIYRPRAPHPPQADSRRIPNYARVTRATYSPGMPLKSLSPSRASDFKTCPRLFKFRVIERIPEPTTPQQARGTTAHAALQRLFDLPAPERTPEALFGLFRMIWAESRSSEFAGLFPGLEEERAWGIESLELLANYFTIEDPRCVDPTEREMYLKEDLDGMTINGILDRMEETGNGQLAITDYKTGKAPPEQYAMSAFFALKIYAMLIRQATGRTPGIVRLIYLNGPTVSELEISDGQLDAVNRQMRALWGAIEHAMEQDDFPTRVSRLCDWCSFQSICPAWTNTTGTAEPAEVAAG